MIKQIGNKLDTRDFEQIEFLSNQYLLDADIIIVDFEAVQKEVRNLLNFDLLYYIITENNYDNLIKIFKERTEQFLNYLTNRGNVFVFNSNQSTVSFTVFNKNKSETDINLDLLTLFGLSSDQFSAKKQSGRNVFFTEKYKNIFNVFNCSYNSIFEKFIGEPTCFIKQTNEVIGLRIPKYNGNLFFLPDLVIGSNNASDQLKKSLFFL